MYAAHEPAQHLCHRVLSLACPGYLTAADIKGDVGATRDSPSPDFAVKNQTWTYRAASFFGNRREWRCLRPSRGEKGMVIDYADWRILSIMVLRQLGRSAGTFGRRGFAVTSEEWV